MCDPWTHSDEHFVHLPGSNQSESCRFDGVLQIVQVPCMHRLIEVLYENECIRSNQITACGFNTVRDGHSNLHVFRWRGCSQIWAASEHWQNGHVMIPPHTPTANFRSRMDWCKVINQAVSSAPLFFCNPQSKGQIPYLHMAPVFGSGICSGGLFRHLYTMYVQNGPCKSVSAESPPRRMFLQPGCP